MDLPYLESALRQNPSVKGFMSSVLDMPEDLLLRLDELDRSTQMGTISTKAEGSKRLPNMASARARWSNPSTPNFGARIGNSRLPASSQAVDESDIFHSNSDENIFQIVSRKLLKKRDAIQPLDWALPYNRDVHKLTTKPKRK
jgi:hypothetical protein